MSKNKKIALIVIGILLILIVGIVLFAYKHRKVLKKCYDGFNISEEIDCIIKNHNSHHDKGDKIPILTFHRIMSDDIKEKNFSDNQWAQAVSVFEEQMKYLYDNGYKTLSMDEFYCWYKGKCKYEEKSVVLTFDDGDISIYYLVMPILKKYNFKGTSFIIGKYTEEAVDEEFDECKRQYITKNIIKKSEKEYPNLEYQSHSYGLHDGNNKQRIYSLSKSEIQKDFDKMKDYNFEYMSYPYGFFTDNLTRVVKNNNYKLGFTFGYNKYAYRTSLQYEIPRIKVNGYSDVNYIKKVVEGNFKISDIVTK